MQWLLKTCPCIRFGAPEQGQAYRGNIIDYVNNNHQPPEPEQIIILITPTPEQNIILITPTSKQNIILITPIPEQNIILSPPPLQQDIIYWPISVIAPCWIFSEYRVEHRHKD